MTRAAGGPQALRGRLKRLLYRRRVQRRSGGRFGVPAGTVRSKVVGALAEWGTWLAPQRPVIWLGPGQAEPE